MFTGRQLTGPAEQRHSRSVKKMEKRETGPLAQSKGRNYRKAGAGTEKICNKAGEAQKEMVDIHLVRLTKNLSTMPKKYVPEGAYLACDKGTSPSTLRVTNNVNTTIYTVAMATEADKLPFFNIKPMGLCAIKGGPCLPMVLQWDNPKDGVKINGNRMLLEDSTCKCMLGGEIKIFFDRASAVGYGLGSGKMPSEYIKEGFDSLAEQNEALERRREEMLPEWMEGIADVADWHQDLSTGLAEGAINGVVGLGETIYQVAQDPVGTAEAIGGMAQKGWNAAGGAWDWASKGENWEKTFDNSVAWASDGQNWIDAGKGTVQGAKDAAVWVAENPRKIGTTAGEFIPDAAAAVFTGGGSLAATGVRKGLREVAEEVVEHSVDDAIEAGARLGDDALEAGAKRSTAEVLEQLAKKEGDDIAAVVTKNADELADDAAKNVEEIADPPSTFRDDKGRLRNKNGTFAKDPRTKSRTKKPTYQRNMSERKKALLRDAKDPNSGLDQKARDYINKHNGRKVPNSKNKDYDGDIDYEVDHKEPLYTGKTIEEKMMLDTEDNMQTISKSKHRELHKFCNEEKYHRYPPGKYR